MTACLVLRVEVGQITTSRDGSAKDIVGKCLLAVIWRKYAIIRCKGRGIGSPIMNDPNGEDSLHSGDDSKLTMELG